MQYNLRLDENTKTKAMELAKKKGVSENRLYQTAIEDYLKKTDAEDFFQKMLKRIVTPEEKKSVLAKLRKNKAAPFYKEDL